MHDTNLLEDQPIAWTPSPEVIERAQLTRFMKQVGVSTFDELYKYSIQDVEKFTEEVLKFLDIKFDPPYEKLLDTSNGPALPTWFAVANSPRRRGDAESEPGAVATGFSPHAGLNITEMCLDRWQTDEMKDQPALIWEGENEWYQDSVSYEKLRYFVDSVANGLRSRKAVARPTPREEPVITAVLPAYKFSGSLIATDFSIMKTFYLRINRIARKEQRFIRDIGAIRENPLP